MIVSKLASRYPIKVEKISETESAMRNEFIMRR